MNGRDSQLDNTGRVSREVPELFGTIEVSECLGVKEPNLYGKNTPKRMPPPVMRVRATRLWLADEIREFAAQRAAARRGNQTE